MSMRKLLTLLLVVMTSLQMSAQIRGNNITVTVQPDHQDWTYKTGEKATFTIQVLKSGTLLVYSRVSAVLVVQGMVVYTSTDASYWSV